MYKLISEYIKKSKTFVEIFAENTELLKLSESTIKVQNYTNIEKAYKAKLSSLISTNQIGEIEKSFYSGIAKDLHNISKINTSEIECLQGVRIFPSNPLDVIKKYDTSNSLLYVDMEQIKGNAEVFNHLLNSISKADLVLSFTPSGEIAEIMKEAISELDLNSVIIKTEDEFKVLVSNYVFEKGEKWNGDLLPEVESKIEKFEIEKLDLGENTYSINEFMSAMYIALSNASYNGKLPGQDGRTAYIRDILNTYIIIDQYDSSTDTYITYRGEWYLDPKGKIKFKTKWVVVNGRTIWISDKEEIVVQPKATTSDPNQETVNPEDLGKEKTTKLFKADFQILEKATDEQFILGVVLEPNDQDGDDADSQNHIYAEGTVRKTAHMWMEDYLNLNIMHKDSGAGKLTPCESYLVPEDCIIGGQKVKKGSWILAAHVDDEIWEKVKSGEFTGWSIGGEATLQEVA